MPNKELSYVNYNGETYQIVDETANTKFSPLGHHHRVSDIDDFHDTTYTVDTDSGLSMDGTEIAIDNVPVNKGGTGQSSLTSGQVLVGNGTSPVTTRPIDNTNGGTADSTALITSGAVEAGLAGKSNTGHHHTTNEIDDYVLHTFTSPLTENASTHAVSLNTVPVSKGGTGATTLASGQVLIGNGTNAVTTKTIDATAGGTENSTNLISSGAVYDGLAAKSNVGHHHNINEIDDIAFTGTYNKTTNKIVTQDTLNSAIDDIDAESLGLSKAMRFIGKATVAISDGDRTNPTITGYDFGTNGANAKLGDVIIDKDGLYEYV